MKNVISSILKKFDKISPEETLKILKQAEQEISILQMVLDSVTSGFIVCDTKNILLLTNKYANRLLEIEEGGELKELVWAAVKDKDISEFLQKVLLDRERIEDSEFFVDTNGINRLLTISVLPLVKNKKVTGSLILIDDITEKRSQEVKLRRVENLANLTNVAAGVAHEIKNPLASISIYIQLSQKLLRQQLNRISEEGERKSISLEQKTHEKFNKYLTNVEEEVERLNKIVVDFLFAVRPLEFNLIKSDINEQIKSAIDFFKPEFKQNKIIFTLDLQENISFILLDKQFFKQILLNLFKNAIEAMPDGGELIVNTFQRDAEVKIDITDTGIGISEDNKAKIFEPYWTTKIKGTGLGLTMVFKIIREHKGDISVKSELGKGTCFEISLPIPQKEKSLTFV
ncbi:MAG: ATP-binding protein [Termitinemataceae bacterium]|nr:MAG: ATP-binding protein [Termitinemataceae bacterium]